MRLILFLFALLPILIGNISVATPVCSVAIARQSPQKIDSTDCTRSSFEDCFRLVPERYFSHPRFIDLATDPDRKLQNLHTIKEAMAALEALHLGILREPLVRAPGGLGLDFIDGAGTFVDIKTPHSPGIGENWKFEPRTAFQAILNKIQVDTNVVIILDISYLYFRDRQALMKLIRDELTPDQRSNLYILALPEVIKPDDILVAYASNRKFIQDSSTQ